MALRAAIAFSSSDSGSSCWSRRFRTEVVVGVAPTERVNGVLGEADWIEAAVRRSASNSRRRKLMAVVLEMEE